MWVFKKNDTFITFVNNLLENEILVSEFKQSVVGKNFFKKIISILKKYGSNDLLKQLEEIDINIEKFNEINDFELIDVIEGKMSLIKNVNNYLRVDCFYQDIINIPLEKKSLIEEFVSFILSFSSFNRFDNFVLKFKDIYHNDAVLLKDFLNTHNLQVTI